MEPLSDHGDEACYHCGLTAGEGKAIHQDGRMFCCQGCLGAFRLIHGLGLGAYYDRRTGGGTGLLVGEGVDSAVYDDSEFQKEMVRDLPGGDREVHLLLEGIHCAACVWLNEQVLRRIPGVLEAHVNFADFRATVRWHPETTTLGHLIDAIQRVGYKAHPYDPRRVEESHRRRDRSLLIRLGVAGFGAANVMFIAVALYAGTFQGMETRYETFFHWVSLLIACPVVFYSGSVFFHGAWQGIRAGRLTMDFSIALGATVTFLASVVATWGGPGAVYFDSVTLFIFVLLLGRTLESTARRKAAGAAERLTRFQPETVQVLREGVEQRLPLRQVRVDDEVVIRPGERIAVDGWILRGRTTVDESMLTGEAEAVVKVPGSAVIGGTMNVDGGIHVRVRRVGGETTLARILQTVTAAQSSRTLVHPLADRVAAWLVGGVVFLSFVTFVYWWPRDPDQALPNAVALLIITCPCALGLATPAAMLVACGNAARGGMLIRDPGTLERLARIQQVVLDKTGVVTEGKPRLTRSLPATENGIDHRTLLRRVAAVERYSEHPLGQAVMRAFAEQELERLPEAENPRIEPGLGLLARVEGEMTRVGRPEFAFAGDREDRIEIPVDDSGQPVTWVACTVEGTPWGWLGFLDPIRADAVATVRFLKEQGLIVSLLSGDRQASVSWTADRVGIAMAVGGVLPEEKQQVIRALRQEGIRVAMVGDGVNDAPALALADVSLAVDRAADLSRATSDVILLDPGLSSVAHLFAMARQTLRIIRQNLFFSLAYNVVTIPLAVAGWVSPIVAAIAMPVSSLVVVANALRLRGKGSGDGGDGGIFSPGSFHG
ncbi:MAG: heavy metal translocating P-type ATPase [Magnetococcales bacterium]|nr:heavy metal translocating P-type ATPase [Magnetococcales bacterium]